MSPELNGNPPSVTKRKKNRDKAQVPSQASTNPFSMDMSSNHCFPVQPYNLSIPDLTAYYSYMNYTNPSEPMSLPVYPLNYPNYNIPGNVPFMGVSKHATLPGDMHMNEYLSLPVANLDQNEESGKRRFSDPGLPNESDSSSNSMDDRAVRKLYDQINSLGDANRRLTQEVMEMRNEITILKQQQSPRHREYEPGMLADIIREVRDAARVREDALLARVKHIIEEKQLSLNHLQLVSEKNRNNDRISKLEEQLKHLNMEHSRSDDSNHQSLAAIEGGSSTARQILELEKEALELRRELQDTRAKKEEADQKVVQLDKKLSSIMRRNDISLTDMSEDGKTSMDSLSTTSSTSQVPRVTLSGPVTDL